MEMVARFRLAERVLDRARQGLSCVDMQQQLQMVGFGPEEPGPEGLARFGVAPTSAPLWFNRQADEGGLRGGTPEQRELWMAFNMLFLVSGHVMPESCRPPDTTGSTVPEVHTAEAETEEATIPQRSQPPDS
jgi:hypothetical protein